MIKNMVFDMGNVLIRYDAARVCDVFVRDEAAKERIRTAIFLSPEWVYLDMGVMEEEEALEKMVSRLSSEREKEDARQCFYHWHEYNMWPVEEMGDLVKELKERGYQIYLCSNASLRLWKCYKTVIPGIEWFDGIMFSASEKCIKPQKEIYERLFERFRLKPEECFFIDDLRLNIDGAAACGMKGYCFDGDLKRLRETLDQLQK
ncbi:MAG: HAD family phosphatase [Clostridiales bacterium]|nr:HAD family phosphatase [Clostridiales bacterium]